MEADNALGPGAKDLIDWETFGQLLEMDDEGTDHEFSRNIIEKYYEQAESTLKDMDAALAAGDLDKLGNLGHFLKGSTASLGLTKVRDTCEDIQNVSEADSKDDIQTMITRLRAEYGEIRTRLVAFYANPSTI